jgi:hypothetical protein
MVCARRKNNKQTTEGRVKSRAKKEPNLVLFGGKVLVG